MMSGALGVLLVLVVFSGLIIWRLYARGLEDKPLGTPPSAPKPRSPTPADSPRYTEEQLVEFSADMYERGLEQGRREAHQQRLAARASAADAKRELLGRVWDQDRGFCNFSSEEDLQRALQAAKGRPLEVCFTGWPQEMKDMMQQVASAEGMYPRAAIAKRVAILVAGPNAGPTKVSDAQAKGVAIISGERFVQLIKDARG